MARVICLAALLFLVDFRVNMCVSGQLDTTVCTPNVNDSASALPKLADTYLARMEWKLIEQKKWVYVEEFFDGPGNRAALRLTGVYDPGKVVLFISDFTTDEYFTIQDGMCAVTKLSASDTFTLPFQNVNGSAAEVLSVHRAMKFGQSYNEKYVGLATVRNISALHFESCTYRNDTKQTIKIDFYFSDGKTWTTPSGAILAPIRSMIHRKIGSGSDSFESHEQYDIVYFQEYIDDYSVFQIPGGIYCDGRKNTKPTPNIPNYFTFRAEMVVPSYNTIGAYDEWYDYSRKMVRIDSKPMPGGVVIVPMVTRRDVHDFNAGVSYMVDMTSGDCHVAPLSADIFDSKLTDLNHIAIKSPKQFFDFTSGVFVYSGQKTERGITMDTWIGKRLDFPPGLNLTSYWEWYFSADKWLISEFGPSIRSAPMRLKITIPGANATFIYNIFDFTEDEPDISVFDVSYCYEKGDIRDFRFTLTGKSWAISPKPKLFKYNMATAIARAMGVASPRIQAAQADFDNKGVYVLFTLLGPPPVKGDTGNPINSVSSDTAANNFRQSLDSGQFSFQSTIVKPSSGQQTFTYTGVPHSMKEVIRSSNGTLTDLVDTTTSGSTMAAPTLRQRITVQPPGPTPAPTHHSSLVGSPSGWQGGSVAGIAIGMTVLGLFLGVISTFVALKLKRKSDEMTDTLVMNKINE
ncbi:uncharacterized protein [Haliotis cracherodii]|uniref:uncharacterized protein n=1 Tax=Haliotis cracherodii TaxID=6455 RepID=UPI0039EBC56A